MTSVHVKLIDFSECFYVGEHVIQPQVSHQFDAIKEQRNTLIFSGLLRRYVMPLAILAQQYK